MLLSLRVEQLELVKRDPLQCGTPVGDVGRITLATHLVFVGDSQCERTYRATSCNSLLGWPVSIAQSGLSHQVGS